MKAYKVLTSYKDKYYSYGAESPYRSMMYDAGLKQCKYGFNSKIVFVEYPVGEVVVSPTEMGLWVFKNLEDAKFLSRKNIYFPDPIFEVEVDENDIICVDKNRLIMLCSENTTFVKKLKMLNPII